MFAHGLHQFVHDHPSGVVAHPQLALEIHRRNPILGLREQAYREVPAAQRQLGVLEQSACGERGLVLAADALEDLAGVPLAVLVVATVRTAEAFRPVRLEQRLGALLVGSVDLEQVSQPCPFWN